jgi:hypothetical protein
MTEMGRRLPIRPNLIWAYALDPAFQIYLLFLSLFGQKLVTNFWWGFHSGSRERRASKEGEGSSKPRDIHSLAKPADP